MTSRLTPPISGRRPNLTFPIAYRPHPITLYLYRPFSRRQAVHIAYRPHHNSISLFFPLTETGCPYCISATSHNSIFLPFHFTETGCPRCTSAAACDAEHQLYTNTKEILDIEVSMCDDMLLLACNVCTKFPTKQLLGVSSVHEIRSAGVLGETVY